MDIQHIRKAQKERIVTARRSISTGDSLELRDNLEVKLSPARGMNKTLYIREEDAAIWDRARELTGEKLSNFLTQLLKAYVAEQEAKALGLKWTPLSRPFSGVNKLWLGGSNFLGRPEPPRHSGPRVGARVAPLRCPILRSSAFIVFQVVPVILARKR